MNKTGNHLLHAVKLQLFPFGLHFAISSRMAPLLNQKMDCSGRHSARAFICQIGLQRSTWQNIEPPAPERTNFQQLDNRNAVTTAGRRFRKIPSDYLDLSNQPSVWVHLRLLVSDPQQFFARMWGNP